jgi:hypothetical protein
MGSPGIGNRAMFWRIVRRLLGANRGRLFVILLALGAGAAVTAALLNLQVDAKRRITTEFRTFGANVLITPPEAKADAPRAQSAGTLDSSLFDKIPNRNKNGDDLVAKAALLYGVAKVAAWDMRSDETTSAPMDAVIVGVQLFGHELGEIFPSKAAPFPKGSHRMIV